MDNTDMYWDDINDYEQIPPFDEEGRLPGDDDYGVTIPKHKGNEEER